MDYRREALLGIVNAAIVFVPVFLAILFGPSTAEQIRAARERRIADYRKSPESQLLRLNY